MFQLGIIFRAHHSLSVQDLYAGVRRRTHTLTRDVRWAAPIHKLKSVNSRAISNVFYHWNEQIISHKYGKTVGPDDNILFCIIVSTSSKITSHHEMMFCHLKNASWILIYLKKNLNKFLFKHVFCYYFLINIITVENFWLFWRADNRGRNMNRAVTHVSVYSWEFTQNSILLINFIV